MGPVAQQVVLAAALLAAVLAVAALVALHRLRRRGSDLVAELRDSRAQLEALNQRLDTLSREVARPAGGVRGRDSGPGADPAADPEYVITSLTEGRPGDRPLLEPQVTPVGRVLVPRRRPPLGAVLEDRLVVALARRRSSAGGGAETDLATDPLASVVVRAASLWHGVRRSLAPDNLDRAVAEAHLARRRSRRRRRRELRDVRRLHRAAGPVS